MLIDFRKSSDMVKMGHKSMKYDFEILALCDKGYTFTFFTPQIRTHGEIYQNYMCVLGYSAPAVAPLFDNLPQMPDDVNGTFQY